LPEILQTVGSTMRNFGLIGIGFGLIRNIKIETSHENSEDETKQQN